MTENDRLTGNESALLERFHNFEPAYPGDYLRVGLKDDPIAEALYRRGLLDRHSPSGLPGWIYSLSPIGFAECAARRIIAEMRDPHPQT